MSDTTMTRRPRGTDWAMILLVYLISMLGASALSRSGTRVGNVAAAASIAAALDAPLVLHDLLRVRVRIVRVRDDHEPRGRLVPGGWGRGGRRRRAADHDAGVKERTAMPTVEIRHCPV